MRRGKTHAGSREEKTLNHAIIDETTTPKHGEKQGFGKLLSGSTTNHFAGSGHNSQNINIRGDVQRSNLARWVTGEHVSAVCPTSPWLTPRETQQ
jgi:hypothetical protein